MLGEVLKAHSGCGEKGVGPIHALMPIPLEWHKAWSQQVVVTFTETVMLSLLLCLLRKIHGYLCGDSCCFITSFPMAKKGRKASYPGNETKAAAWESGRKASNRISFVKFSSENFL